MKQLNKHAPRTRKCQKWPGVWKINYNPVKQRQIFFSKKKNKKTRNIHCFLSICLIINSVSCSPGLAEGSLTGPVFSPAACSATQHQDKILDKDPILRRIATFPYRDVRGSQIVLNYVQPSPPYTPPDPWIKRLKWTTGQCIPFFPPSYYSHDNCLN